MVRIGTILCIFAVSTACRRPEPAPAVVDSVSTGRFLAEYEPADPDFREFRSRLIANRFLDTIATRLNISVKTVEFHKTRLMRRLGKHGTAELTRVAVATGLIRI